MPRVKKPTKVKEPIRLRMKPLSDGSKSLYLDIYRDGKRTYEYLKMYIIPETDNNARKRNQVTMDAANAIKSKRIIELTNGEAGIENREKVFLLDWMNTYKENQAKRGKKDGNQISVTIRILKDYAGERMTMDKIDKTFCQDYLDYLMTEYRPKGKRVSNFTLHTYYRILNGASFLIHLPAQKEPNLNLMNNMKNTLVTLCLSAVLCGACCTETQQQASPFVQVEKGMFVRDGKPYKYIGANFWYGGILASEGEGGNRERLVQELDSLKSIGIDNLRILVGSDGARGITSKVEPTLQTAPGVYNDTILAGLDFLLSEMKKRDMLAVLYLNNSWEWSGGYSQYLEWAGKGKAPVPSIDGWPAFMDYVKEFPNNKKAKSLFADYVKDIITRINRYTNISYVEDPTIMSWQIGNEPRAFSGENKEAFAIWMAEVSRFIKSLDRNHLVSTGSEGKHGCEEDLALFERIHADKHIDYMNIHIWPYNWGWAPADSLSEKAEAAQLQSKQYIDEHLEIAQKYGKPLVLEEFGYPRDGFRFDKSATTQARDTYYQYIFSLITDRTAQSAGLTGCNFWAWGGLAAPKHLYWQRGDDYTGDPAQEQQGLNSVFMSDSTTIAIIRTANQQLKQHSF